MRILNSRKLEAGFLLENKIPWLFLRWLSGGTSKTSNDETLINLIKLLHKTPLLKMCFFLFHHMTLLNHRKVYRLIRVTGNVMTSRSLSFLNDKNLIKANTESSNLWTSGVKLRSINSKFENVELNEPLQLLISSENVLKTFRKNNTDNIKIQDDNTNDESVRKSCILIRQNRASVKM